MAALKSLPSLSSKGSKGRSTDNMDAESVMSLSMANRSTMRFVYSQEVDKAMKRHMPRIGDENGMVTQSYSSFEDQASFERYTNACSMYEVQILSLPRIYSDMVFMKRNQFNIERRLSIRQGMYKSKSVLSRKSDSSRRNSLKSSSTKSLKDMKLAEEETKSAKSGTKDTPKSAREPLKPLVELAPTPPQSNRLLMRDTVPVKVVSKDLLSNKVVSKDSPASQNKPTHKDSKASTKDPMTTSTEKLPTIFELTSEGKVVPSNRLPNNG